MRLIIVLLVASITSVNAQTIYLNYGQWEQMPIGFREIYLAGAFDALSTITTPKEVATAKHYNECVARAGLTSGQLEQNLEEYAKTNPGLQDKPVPNVLVRYLISLCGLPTAQ